MSHAMKPFATPRFAEATIRSDSNWRCSGPPLARVHAKVADRRILRYEQVQLLEPVEDNDQMRTVGDCRCVFLDHEKPLAV